MAQVAGIRCGRSECYGGGPRGARFLVPSFQPITKGVRQTFLADFQPCQDHFAVPDMEQRELFAIVESTKGEIVRPEACC